MQEPFPSVATTSIYAKKLELDITWPAIITSKQDLDHFHSYASKSFDQ